MDCFIVLGIEPTEDHDKIKQAYRDKLPSFHPEDNPEGFRKLREAYEDALKYKAPEILEDTELNHWLQHVDDIYQDFTRRMDMKQWDELLEADICFSLDTVNEASNGILLYLMDHYYLSHEIWNRLEQHFAWEEKKLELYDKFPPRFIDFVCANAKYEDEFRYPLFVLEKGKPYEEFLRNYFYLVNNFGTEDAQERDQRMNENISSGIKHPDFTILRIRYALKSSELELALELANELLEDYPNDVKGWYLAALVESERNNTEQAILLADRILVENPEHVGAMIIKGDIYVKDKKYEDALEEYQKALNSAPYYGYLHNSIHSMNTLLAKEYVEKYGELPSENHIRLKLLQYKVKSNQIEGILELLNSIDIEKDHKLEYYKLAAEAYSHMKEYDKAHECYETAMEYCKDDKEELSELYADSGLQLLDLGKTQEALEKYDEGLGVYPNSIRLTYRKAAALTKLARYQESVELCNGILSKEEIPNAYHFRAEAYYKMGEYQKALEDAKSAVGLIPYYVTYIMQLDIYQELQQFEMIIELTDYMMSIGFINTQVQLYKVRALIDLERYNDGEKVVNDVLEIEPDNSEAWYRYALISWYQGKPWEALKGIEKSENQVDDIYGHIYLKASIYVKLGRHQEAEELYESLIQDENCSSKDYVYTRIGFLYETKNEHKKAIEFYKKSLELTPEYSYIHGKISDLYEILEDYDNALKYNKIELQLNPDTYLYYQRGRIYKILGMREKSKEYFIKAVEYGPDDSYSHYSLGVCYMEDGEIDKAIDCFNHAVDNEYPGSGVYFNLGICLQRMNRYEDAIQIFEQGMKECKDVITLIFRKACLLEHIKEYDKAILEYTKYYNETGENMWKNIRIGRCYKRKGDYKNAVKYMKAAKKDEKNSYEPYEEMGDIYADELRKYKKAIRWYEKAYNLNPSSSYLPFNIAECLCKLGRDKEAKRYFLLSLNHCEEDLKQSDVEPCDYEMAGSVYLALKNYDKAMECFQQAIQMTAAFKFCYTLECHEAYFGIGKIYEEQGDYQLANKNFEKALSISDDAKYREALQRINQKIL